ncbi:hypothetical protein TRIUR3_07884 [Triticum urartu]|uniref:Uncharacterized protein n=1 Tax=Triticum urartu TaxID=4572 RepID=M7Z4A6_TRIUA|nr:hypothetical protein TRIUR3_07884 [Triticum urartu]
MAPPRPLKTTVAGTKDPGQEPFAFNIGKGSMIKGDPLCSWARNGSAAHNLRLL